jgi:MFS family permease
MKPGRRRWFFTGMGFAVLATVSAGFAPTYYLKPLFATPALPLSVHIHGALFSAWVLLFAAQTSLVAANRTDLHKRLGSGGAVLAVAMVVSGLVVAIASARAAHPALGALATAPPLFVLVIPLASVVVFTILAGLGLYYRRRADAHKRLMLLATIALLPPALGRIRVLSAAGPSAFFGVTVLFIVAVVAYDNWTRRRVHPVSLWGGLFLALSFPARIAVGHTEAWLTFARWLVR